MLFTSLVWMLIWRELCRRDVGVNAPVIGVNAPVIGVMYANEGVF
ncbi:MAG: hypothetical protein ACRC5E_05445 [Shewanella sp.]